MVIIGLNNIRPSISSITKVIDEIFSITPCHLLIWLWWTAWLSATQNSVKVDVCPVLGSVVVVDGCCWNGSLGPKSQLPVGDSKVQVTVKVLLICSLSSGIHFVGMIFNSVVDLGISLIY